MKASFSSLNEKFIWEMKQGDLLHLSKPLRLGILEGYKKRNMQFDFCFAGSIVREKCCTREIATVNICVEAISTRH
jgi:hypothetical protein